MKERYSLEEVFVYLRDNANQLFKYYETSFQIKENYFSFCVPIFNFQTSKERNIYAMIEVNFFKKEEELTIVNNFSLYDKDRGVFIKIPSSCDLEIDSFDYILDNFLDLGFVETKEMRKEVKYLFGFIYKYAGDDSIFLNDVSMALIKEVSIIIRNLNNKIPDWEYNKNFESKNIHTCSFNY